MDKAIAHAIRGVTVTYLLERQIVRIAQRRRAKVTPLRATRKAPTIFIRGRQVRTSCLVRRTLRRMAGTRRNSRFYRVPLGSTGFHWALQGSLGSFQGSTRCCEVLCASMHDPVEPCRT